MEAPEFNFIDWFSKRSPDSAEGRLATQDNVQKEKNELNRGDHERGHGQDVNAQEVRTENVYTQEKTQ